MCQKCVDDGLMTQDQRDRINAGEDPSKVLSQEQITAMIDGSGVPQPEAVVFSADNLDDAPDFIKNLFAKAQGETRSPEDEAKARMDESVYLIMKFIKDKRDLAARAEGDPDALTNPRVKDAFMEMLAGEAMYKMNAGTIAYILMVLADRYVDLLDQWSTMYVNAASDPDDLITDLDQAKTPESKVAFATKSQEFTAKTVKAPGMYL